MPKYLIKLWDRADREVFFQHDPETKPLTKVNKPPELVSDIDFILARIEYLSISSHDL